MLEVPILPKSDEAKLYFSNDDIYMLKAELLM